VRDGKVSLGISRKSGGPWFRNPPRGQNRPSRERLGLARRKNCCQRLQKRQIGVYFCWPGGQNGNFGFFLTVTTEPEVDTPAVLQTYANRLDANLASWAFLTGHPQAVQGVWQAFGLTVKRRAKGGVEHPAWTFLIDREGRVRYRYIGGLLEVETVLEDMRHLG
jgi:hypothetical protein